MSEVLQQEFMGFTLFQIIVTLAIIVVGISIIQKIVKAFSKEKETSFGIKVKCLNCGWVGSVGKYDRRCRRCSSDSLEELR